MAEEQIDTRTEVLRRLGSSAKQILLDPELLVVGVAGLNAIATAVLIVLAVLAAALAAALL